MQTPDIYQQRVIKSQNNLLVIAGPGSGKTTTMIAKINYLLNFTKAQDILVISYTNQSVNDLKKKIKSNVFVCTFHKLAIDILDYYKYPYLLAEDTLLNYIINEYFETYPDIQKLYRKLNVTNKNNYKFKDLKKLIVSFISIFNTNGKPLDILYNIINTEKDNLIVKIILDIIKIYEEEKKSTNKMDFDDLIIIATKILKTNYKYKSFKYIIIDEFQDTSLIRLNLILEIYNHCNSTITAVGDDAQSIYKFSGCDLNIFLNFTKYFPNSEILYLKNTYRNSQELINITSSFINKNAIQIKKNMISTIHSNKPIHYIYYINPIKALKKILFNLKNEEVLILSRNKHDIYKFIDKDITYNANEQLIYFNNYSYKYLTMHSAKGLEADYVIIINLTNKIYGMPNQIIDNNLLKYVSPNKEMYPYAEERRLFFVALTRCKISNYLLVPIFNKSNFIKELKKIKY